MESAKPDPQAPLMTIEEGMATLRCSRGTIRNLRKAGTIRTVHPRPGLPRLVRADVQKLVEPESR